jgi:hypothetical protein
MTVSLGSTGKCLPESNEHLKMRSIASTRLEHDRPAVTDALKSTVYDRIADVLLTIQTSPVPRSNCKLEHYHPIFEK